MKIKASKNGELKNVDADLIIIEIDNNQFRVYPNDKSITIYNSDDQMVIRPIAMNSVEISNE